MRRLILNIIAVVEGRDEGYADFPVGCLDEGAESELACFGYAIGFSEARWLGGYRIYAPESIAAGNYRPYVPPSVFTCADSRNARIPEARDFDFEAVLRERGIIPTN